MEFDEFTTDYRGVFLLPEGRYEAIIYKTELRNFSSGNKGLKLLLIIRDDVDQLHGGRIISDPLVATQNSLYKFQMLAQALGLPDGVKLSLNDFSLKILYKPVAILVKHQDYEGQKRARVSLYMAPHLNEQIGNRGSENRITTSTSEAPERIVRYNAKLNELNGYTQEELEWIC